MKYLLNCLLLVLLITSSCEKSNFQEFEERYEVEMIGTWSNTTHPTDFPSNAHFSPMIGLSHAESLDPISPGLSATVGVKLMAETGSTDTLEAEFNAFEKDLLAVDQIKGVNFDSPGSNKAEIGVKAGFHHVTIFSMIAPSPDWFVAATTSLLDPADGEWYDEVTVYASSYDAGTDAGLSFNDTNQIANPIQTVQLLQNGPLSVGNDTVKNMAKFIFRRIVE